MKVAPSGTVDASVGLMGSGQGYETALAQAVAEGLGVAAEDVRMHLGHTDTAPYCTRMARAAGVRAAARLAGLCCCWRDRP